MKFRLTLLLVLVFVVVSVGSIFLHISALSRQIEKSEAELKYFMWWVLELRDRAAWDSVRICDTTYTVFLFRSDVDSTVIQPDNRVVGYYVDTIVSDRKEIKWELIKNLLSKGGMFSEYRAAGNSRKFSAYDTTFDTVFVLRSEIE